MPSEGLTTAKAALATDYAAMLADEIMIGNSVPFDELLKTCANVEARATQYISDEANHNPRGRILYAKRSTNRGTDDIKRATPEPVKSTSTILRNVASFIFL